MDPLSQFAAALLGVFVIYSIVHRWTRISVADIPGPEPESFLLGCLPELLQSQAGEADFKWHARFGGVVRVKGILGTDRLLISDPKAIHHIYNSGYNIRKPPFRTVLIRLFTGPGLVWANNEIHARQRRVNSPAFGANEARSYIPIFTAYARLSAQWKELTADESAVVNVPPYFARFFLDVIGEVAFDYQFGATDDAQSPFAEALSSVMPAVFSPPSKTKIFVASVMEFLPVWMFQLFVDYAPVAAFQNSRRVERMAVGIAKELVDEKAEALVAGKGKRDIMSLLVRANASTNPRTSLSEAEMLAQMQTTMQAGHETTANTMGWSLFELTQHPDVQKKLRAEILATEKAIHARGDSEFTHADFEAMPYTVAVMKETYRFHPVLYHNHREAARDEVLPLSKPLVSKSGKIITELPIPKNMSLCVSAATYNRNTDVFGEDAHVFNPERWLDGTVQTTTKLGVYGNLMTFGSGIRSCIGWRFAVYEYQAFLVELMKNFEFSMDASIAGKVRREASVVMAPSVSGEEGSQLPITIRAVDTL
ncbi:cytochrome P450 [Mycena epipterygia]|nr:cytochrome P450 [Mycena epipterygia]